MVAPQALSKTIQQIATTYFPGYAAIMLIGSQVGNTQIDPKKDCDVLLFHPCHSRMFSKKLVLAKQQFDFTVVPLCDVENILYNESYDIHGILANMISPAQVIFDTGGIATFVQEFERDTYTGLNQRTKKHYESLVGLLNRVGKRFTYEMPLHERVFLVCEFVSMVLSVESIKARNNLSGVKQKSRMLYARNREMADLLTDFVKSVSLGEGLLPLQNFWAKYKESLAAGPKLQATVPKCVMFDIGFEDFSMQYFAGFVLKPILAHPLLGRKYQYYYAGPGNYMLAYKNMVSILFLVDNPDMIFELEDALKETIGKNNLQQVECDVVFPKQRNVDKAFDIAIEQMNICLCKLHTDMLAMKDYPEDQLLMGIQLCCLLIKAFGDDIEDIAKANLLLSQRYFFSVREQKEAWPFRLLEELKKTKTDELSKQFSRKRLLVLSTMIGVFDNAYRSTATAAMLQVENYIFQMAVNRPQYKSTQKFPLAILGYYGIGNPQNAFIYMTIAEEIVQMLNLDIKQKKECFYFLTEGIRYCQ